MDSSTTNAPQPWFLQSSYPVLFPAHDALKKSQVDFEAFLKQDLASRHDDAVVDITEDNDKPMTDAETETFTVVAGATDTTSAEIRHAVEDMQVDDKQQEQPVDAPSNPFMDGLRNHGKEEEQVRNLAGMMTTTNGDLTYSSSKDALVDLFQELEEVVTGPRLSQLLQAAWAADPLSTLKIILNARSIHLGKSSKNTFYRCAGWLAQNHPLTLVSNLRWLSRPIIEKKAKKLGDDDDDIVVVDKDDSDVTKYDVENGVAHGYWKDLLNMLALAANEKLHVLSDPRDVLNSENPGILRGKSISRLRKAAARRGGKTRGRGGARGRGGGRGGLQAAVTREQESAPVEAVESVQPAKPVNPKMARRQLRDHRHEEAVKAFNTDPVYRAIHLTVARLFAEQLETDLRALRGTDPKAKRHISLCGKWAPSHDHFHDRHTFVVSSIAEILYPRDSLDAVLPTDDRNTYLRYAREEYRKDTSALRKHLEVVERDLSAKTYQNIKYDRIPSIAMNKYSKLFIEKDLARFEGYIDKVAQGKAKISGATLMPSTLVLAQKSLVLSGNVGTMTDEEKARLTPEQLVEKKIAQIEAKVADGQWNALVQRIKDSGTLDNCIAVCDVSGSMSYPTFKDKTCPMDSAIGLSLLIAEVAEEPWKGSFITFHSNPSVVTIDTTKSLGEKVSEILNSSWGYSTDFVAVFEKLILPMAIKNQLKKEDMVKRIFVFSDMQFNQAGSASSSSPSRWVTSYERIQSAYQIAGYDMPELVFWNLAGGGSGIETLALSGLADSSWSDDDESGSTGDDEDKGNAANSIAPKPVTAADEGTCLVSGYSQGLLKVFLDNGSFESAEPAEEEEAVVVNEDGETEPKKKKAKMDPISIVQKAIGHKAYEMLKVVD